MSIQVTVTAKDMNNGAVLPGQLMVMEAYTNTPQCAPMAATPNCPVTCIPYNAPWVRSRSCDSVPHVNSAQMVTPSKSTRFGAEYGSLHSMVCSLGNSSAAVEFCGMVHEI